MPNGFLRLKVPLRNGFAQLPVSIAEGYALHHQFVHRFHAVQVIVAGIIEYVFVDLPVLKHKPADFQVIPGRFDGGQQALLEQLKIAMVAAAQVVGRSGEVI